jgi:hypothetical protein
MNLPDNIEWYKLRFFVVNSFKYQKKERESLLATVRKDSYVIDIVLKLADQGYLICEDSKIVVGEKNLTLTDKGKELWEWVHTYENL